MSTEIAMFSPSAGMPAHLADLNDQTNIEIRESLPMLSFRGKVWRISAGGSEEIIYNRDGDPVQSVNVVILDYNKARSRAYFEGAYVEGQSTPPTCWSNDGVTPDPKGKKVQAAKCASCPQSVKGSRMTPDGKEITACSQFKRAVVVPAADTTFQPLLLKLPQTSMWDKDGDELAEKKQYAFDQYMEMLLRSNVKHTALVITKIKFDPRTSYPKLLFTAVDWLPEALKGNILTQLAKKDEIGQILNVAPDGVPAESEEVVVTGAAEVAAPPAPVAAPAAPAPVAPAPVAPKPPVAPKAPPKPPVAPVVAPAPAGDPDDAIVLGKPTAAAVAAAQTTAINVPATPAAPPVATTVANPKLAAMLSTWDDAPGPA